MWHESDGGLVHISGPLRVVYEEMRAMIMCYNRVESVKIAAETKFVTAGMELFGWTTEAADEALSAFWESMNRDREGSCCLDYVVGLQDTVELWQAEATATIDDHAAPER